MSYKIGRNLEYLYVISVFPLGELWRMAHNLKTLRVVCLLSVGPDTNGVCPSLRDVQYECGRYTDGQGIVRELENAGVTEAQVKRHCFEEELSKCSICLGSHVVPSE